jgi:hypothetical protein
MTLWLCSLALAAPPSNRTPPQLYLSEQSVRAALHQHLPTLAPCFSELTDPDATFDLAVFLGPDGQARSPELTPSDTEREACLASALRGLGFPRHHEDPVLVRTILVPRNGRLVPHPMVELTQRPESLLFIYVDDPVAAAAILASLRAAKPSD